MNVLRYLKKVDDSNLNESLDDLVLFIIKYKTMFIDVADLKFLKLF